MQTIWNPTPDPYFLMHFKDFHGHMVQEMGQLINRFLVLFLAHPPLSI